MATTNLDAGHGRKKDEDEKTTASHHGGTPGVQKEKLRAAAAWALAVPTGVIGQDRSWSAGVEGGNQGSKHDPRSSPTREQSP